MWPISYPPVNGASLGSIFGQNVAFLAHGPGPAGRPLFRQIKFFENIHFGQNVLNFFSAHSVQPVLR